MLYFLRKIRSCVEGVITVVIFLFLSGCDYSKNEFAAFKVEYKGALKNMMRKGDISAKADLSQFREVKHLYGLGAMEKLKGEIQIFDGKPINTSIEAGNLIIDNSYNKKATLFVYSVVENWMDVFIPDSINTYESLENFIELSAKGNLINIKNPFPFLIIGIPESLHWHVIDWPEGDTDHTHEKHKNSGVKGILENEPVEMLGFYSTSHHAIFTHHTTNMHIHVKSSNNKIAGHVDDLKAGKGMILKLPTIQ